MARTKKGISKKKANKSQYGGWKKFKKSNSSNAVATANDSALDVIFASAKAKKKSKSNMKRKNKNQTKEEEEQKPLSLRQRVQLGTKQSKKKKKKKKLFILNVPRPRGCIPWLHEKKKNRQQQNSSSHNNWHLLQSNTLVERNLLEDNKGNKNLPTWDLDPVVLCQLDKELIEFTHYVQLTDAEYVARNHVIDSIRNLAKPLFEQQKGRAFDEDDVQLQLFGSFATPSVCTFTSDIDIALWNVVPVPPEEEKTNDNKQKTKSNGPKKKNDKVFSTAKKTTTKTDEDSRKASKRARVQKWKEAFEEFDRITNQMDNEIHEGHKHPANDTQCESTTEQEPSQQYNDDEYIHVINEPKSNFNNSVQPKIDNSKEQRNRKAESVIDLTGSEKEGEDNLVDLSKDDDDDDDDIAEKSEDEEEAENHNIIQASECDFVQDDHHHEDCHPPNFETDDIPNAAAIPCADDSHLVENEKGDPEEEECSSSSSDTDSCKEVMDPKLREYSAINAVKAAEESDDDNDLSSSSSEELQVSSFPIEGRTPSTEENFGEFWKSRSAAKISSSSSSSSSSNEEAGFLSDDEGGEMDISLIMPSNYDDDDDNDDECDDGGDEDNEEPQIAPSFGPTGRTRVLVIKALNKLSKMIRREEYAQKIEVIRRARVPIIKMTTKLGFETDIALGGHNGTDTSAFAATQSARFKSFSVVTLFLKILLAQQEMDAPFTGGLGSYKLYVLVAHHLERHLEIGGADAPGEVLLSFLFRYGKIHQFKFPVHPLSRTRICQNTTVRVNDSSHMADLSATFRIDDCVSLFQQCFARLMNRLYNATELAAAHEEDISVSVFDSLFTDIIDINKLRGQREMCIAKAKVKKGKLSGVAKASTTKAGKAGGRNEKLQQKTASTTNKKSKQRKNKKRKSSPEMKTVQDQSIDREAKALIARYGYVPSEELLTGRGFKPKKGRMEDTSSKITKSNTPINKNKKSRKRRRRQTL